jgi:hypothetical protein
VIPVPLFQQGRKPKTMVLIIRGEKREAKLHCICLVLRTTRVFCTLTRHRIQGTRYRLLGWEGRKLNESRVRLLLIDEQDVSALLDGMVMGRTCYG